MGTIFISYRRSDAEGQAGRLFRDLAERFGRDAVFIDVQGLAKGRDFRRVLHERLASSGVLLAIVGKEWVTAADEQGRRRLDNPDDFTRLEISAALKRDIPVIPVLVQGARMPRAEELPEDLRDLVFRDGTELTHARWDSDVRELVTALVPYVHDTSSASAPSSSQPGRWPRVVGSAIAAAVLVAAGYAWLSNYQTHTISPADAVTRDPVVARSATEQAGPRREPTVASDRPASIDVAGAAAAEAARPRIASGRATQEVERGVQGAEAVRPAPAIDHQIVRRSAFRSPSGAGTTLYYYEIDTGVQLDAATGQADFFFKPDAQTPGTRIGVAPVNGARYAARFAGRLPWEVEPGNFVSSAGVYSVEQGVDIPCFTSENRPCTFQIRLEPTGEMFVSVALYQ